MPGVIPRHLYSSDFSLRITPGWLRKLYRVPGIKLWWATCRADALSFVFLLQSCFFYVEVLDFVFAFRVFCLFALGLLLPLYSDIVPGGAQSTLW